MSWEKKKACLAECELTVLFTTDLGNLLAGNSSYVKYVHLVKNVCFPIHCRSVVSCFLMWVGPYIYYVL